MWIFHGLTKKMIVIKKIIGLFIDMKLIFNAGAADCFY